MKAFIWSAGMLGRKYNPLSLQIKIESVDEQDAAELDQIHKLFLAGRPVRVLFEEWVDQPADNQPSDNQSGEEGYVTKFIREIDQE
jgi:hypothetical protein